MDDETDALLLLQFARAPREGQVKTRMLPHLSAAQACALHCELTLWTCKQLLASGLGVVELSVAGDTEDTLFQRCRVMGVTRVSRQRGVDLGQRMYHALHNSLRQFRGVILVGSDCPGIDAAYLRQAAAALRTAQVVIGPATDGGYVLLGARTISRCIFQDIPWGTDQVFARTAGALTRAGLSWVELATLTDIDRPSDLAVWEALRRSALNAPTERP